MRPSLLHIVLIAAALAGCAAAPTHDSKVDAPLRATERGSVEEALRTLDAESPSGDKADLLTNLERGELLRIDARYKDSQTSFEAADVKVNEWEATAKTNPEKLMGQITATLLGDATRPYEGQDYEKVMLTTRMAMNRINLNDLDVARVDIKRTHEREAVIAEFRAKETAAAEKEAKDRGVSGEGKELSGYPIETLNDPEVLALKNGYQNALSHYLAGYVYEALNEPSLAAPGYRHAIELRPNATILQEGLRGLDERTSFRRPKGMTDVLFIVETGVSPARKSQKVTFPIPTHRGVVVVGMAFPVIYPNRDALAIGGVQVGDQTIPAGLVADFNVMARRALKDELPGMQLRAAIRAIGKGVVQDQAYRLGMVAGIVANVAAVATDPEADDRMWRALPERVFVARGFVRPGTYNLRLLGARDGSSTITVQGKHMVVPIRVFENKSYFGQAASFGTAGVVTVSDQPPATAAPVSGKGAAKPAPAPKKAVAATNEATAPAGAKPNAAATEAKPGTAKPATDVKAAAAVAVPTKADAAAKGTPAKDAAPKAAAGKTAPPADVRKTTDAAQDSKSSPAPAPATK